MLVRVLLLLFLLRTQAAEASVPLPLTEATLVPHKPDLGRLVGERLKELQCLVPWGRVLGGPEPGAELCMWKGRSKLCFAARVPSNPAVPPSMSLSFSRATPRCPD